MLDLMILLNVLFYLFQIYLQIWALKSGFKAKKVFSSLLDVIVYNFLR